MARRKTVSIRALVEDVNRRNRESLCEREIRKGWNALLATLLHDSGVYAGFGYLTAKEVPAGQLPGITEGITQDLNGKDIAGHVYPDDSRRVYYLHRTLKA